MRFMAAWIDKKVEDEAEAPGDAPKRSAVDQALKRWTVRCCSCCCCDCCCCAVVLVAAAVVAAAVVTAAVVIPLLAPKGGVCV